MNDSISRKYVSILAFLAIAVLTGGALLKPKKPEPEPPSPSETASLQARLRREELGETATYFAQRAQAMARDVFYDAARESSSVTWEKAGQVLTTARQNPESPAPPLLLMPRDTGPPPPTRPMEQNAGRWLLIIGRTANGQLLWTPGVFGGIQQRTCSGEGYSELIVNARLDSAFSGAAVFDLDGVMVGIVAPCEGAFHLASVASVPALLHAFDNPDRRIPTLYGFAIENLNADTKRLFGIDAGLFVTEVTDGDAADRAGLKPGDVITNVGGKTVASSREVTSALDSAEESEHTVQVLRTRNIVSVQMPSMAGVKRMRAAEETGGIRVLSSIQEGDLIAVAPGTPAYRAGLRTGDRLLHAGEKRNRSAADLPRALSAIGDEPLLVFYRRGAAQRAAVMRK